jgi:hypothetical protein
MEKPSEVVSGACPMRGKPKEPLTTEQRAQIATLSAGGWSANKISKHIGKSRGAVRNVLAEPEIQRNIVDEKAELAAIYRKKARDVVTSIDAQDIAKASLQQKAVSTGILLDKSLLLAGEPTANLSLTVMLDLVAAIRAQRERDDLAASTRNQEQ